MTPIEIKIELMKKGISQQSIADELEARKSEVSMCINGLRVYPPIRKAIAKKLKKPVNKIFNNHHPHLIRERHRWVA